MPKILIVDDEPHIRLLLEQTLEELEDDYDVELLMAENGIMALDLIRGERPELVFLDVMMPKMNGYDVCRTVKRDGELSDVHIIMLTAKGQEYDRTKGEEVGANFYMTKPFNPDEVVDRAKQVLKLW